MLQRQTINVTVPYATNLTSLIPNFTLASGTNFATPADETTPKDFSSPVAYTFTDGSDTRTYTITATRIPASTACNIISFSYSQSGSSGSVYSGSRVGKRFYYNYYALLYYPCSNCRISTNIHNIAIGFGKNTGYRRCN
jgi:hypothetical protein